MSRKDSSDQLHTLKVGDYVKWNKEGCTKNPGRLVGECRICDEYELNAPRWLVAFEGPDTFAEPFAIAERELRVLTSLELLAAAGVETSSSD